ncbi:MAG: hypothetical protein AB7F94_10785 [Nitrospira sp.]
MSIWFSTSRKLSKRGEQNDHDAVALQQPYARLLDIICPVSDRLHASHESD